MTRPLVASLVLTLACCGCQMCDSRCDYLPPVLDGHHVAQPTRAGSALNIYSPVEPPVEGPAITPIAEELAPEAE